MKIEKNYWLYLIRVDEHDINDRSFLSNFFAFFNAYIFTGWMGRRKIILLTAPLITCGYVILGLAQSKIMLYSGRSLVAMAVCLQMSSINVYIAETSHPNIRGSLVIEWFKFLHYLKFWYPSTVLCWSLSRRKVADDQQCAFLVKPRYLSVFYLSAFLLERNCHCNLFEINFLCCLITSWVKLGC